MNATHLTLSLAAAVVPVCLSGANGPRVLPPGTLPADQRLKKLRTLNSYFPFHAVKTPEEWQQRSEQIRRRVLVALGLWPLPERTPLEAVIHDRKAFDDYIIEKVYFQSVPGFYVTGSLYRPKTAVGPNKRPGILCPHGHWPGGRFYDEATQKGNGNIRQQIAAGAERFLEGGRSPLQARCVQLARMGCTVFLYDMIGYADSVQLSHSPGTRESMNTRGNWGFFSPAAELRLETMMGLQTWDSIRTSGRGR